MSELKKLNDLIKKHQDEFEQMFDDVFYYIRELNKLDEDEKAEFENEYLRTTTLLPNLDTIKSAQTAIKILKHNDDIEFPPIAIRRIGYAVRSSALALRKLGTEDMIRLNELGEKIVDREFRYSLTHK